MHRRYWLPGEEIPPAVVTSGGKEGELVMASVKYDIEVQVSRVSVSRLLSEYWNPDPVREACKLCPDYGKVWSCPPGGPEADDYLKPFREGFLIAVKVKYPEETRTLAVSAAKAQEIRNQTYEKVKRNLLLTLLELEKEFPGGICIGAGRCILCSHCARQDGESCRYPKLRRYSITAFGFDFARMVRDLLGIELLWSPDGLPEYDVAVSGLFYT